MENVHFFLMVLEGIYYLLILRQSETSSNMILGRAFGLLVVGICVDMHIVGIEEPRFQQMTEDVNKN